GTVAVLFVDIDRFKDINDSLGHAMGDQLIKLVANRIKRSLSNPDIMVTRQGGDEFVILFNWLGEEQVKEEAETVITAIKQPFIIEGNEINVSASGGLSLYPRHTENLDTLMVYADIAMYTAKKQGGSKVVLYSEEINVRSQEKLRIETRLRTAIKEEKIDVYYQPKVDGRTDTITGAEALLRWTDEELGFVPPDKFISIAEDTGLIHSLWELVMKKACSQVSKWNENQSQPLNLAVNFSAKQFQDPVRLVEQVVSILADSKLLPQHFEVEITESILFNNTNETIKALKKLQEYGIGISIDDFGTGYSSLGYLKTLPIDILKIDRTFIQDIKEDYSNAEIPKAIITMAHGLRLKVIAEGVEEEHQKEFLLKNDCYLMQGYLFSKPLSKENFEKLIKDSY
ncbi:MAG TPA: bifunctional diguanylate cyclase/phosphodiesterase, partial [Chondromyces sp.]|nr:bifunctional diguanylate cyclase/phosphodiesterase [Chondromyces sp.]